MKRVINGLTYNTDTSTAVARYEYEDDKDHDTKATVYQNRGGAFFIVHEWQEPDPRHSGYGHPEMIDRIYFEETSREAIENLMTMGLQQVEVLDEKALALPPEAEDEEEPATTAYLRLPPALKSRIEAAAKADKLSLNAWAIRCFEKCAGSDAAVVALKSF